MISEANRISSREQLNEWLNVELRLKCYNKVVTPNDAEKSSKEC